MSDARDVAWSDSMPEQYDRWLGPALFTPCAADLARRAAGLVTSGGRVLELAAGTGILTIALCDGLDAEITATDLNEAMVDYGRAREPRAHWQTADALKLPFEDNQFDLVICQFGVMFFPDKVRGYQEAARVLRAGGHLLFATWCAVEENNFALVFSESLVEVLGKDPPSFVTRIPYGYHDLAQIRADVEAAGLCIDSIDTVQLASTAESARSIARGFGLGSPLRAALAELGDLDQLVDALGEVIDKKLGAGAVAGRMSFLSVAASPH